MVFRGRGSNRGGGRARGGLLGGRGRGGLPRSAPGEAVKPSPVPAFPVVRRSSAADPPKPPNMASPPTKHTHFNTAKKSLGLVEENEDESAPPVVRSARGPGDRAAAQLQEVTAAAASGFYSGQNPSQTPTATHTSPRSNRATARAKSPASFPTASPHAPGTMKTKSNLDRTSSASSSFSVGKPATSVITTVTEDGTELPQRLNNKIFIDGLPYQSKPPAPGSPTLEEELFDFLRAWKVGKPVRLIKKPGQGFGFVVFKSPHSVDTAVRVLNGRKFLGRALRVEVPKARAFEDAVANTESPPSPPNEQENYRRQVLLTDLAKAAEPELIREVLRDISPQLERRLESVKLTSRNRKAFLTFAAESDVAAAITFLDHFQLLGRRISAVRAAAPGTLPYSRRGPKAAAALGTPPGQPSGLLSDAVAEPDILPVGAVLPAGGRHARAPAPASPPAPAATDPKTAPPTSPKDYAALLEGADEVYVGNVRDQVTVGQLRAHFARCGAIRSCEILVHPQTHRRTGIARVQFALPGHAALAQSQLHGSRLGGAVLRVERGAELSPPLPDDPVAGLHDPDQEKEIDEDAYVAARFGIKNKKGYLKGTSVAEAEEEETETALGGAAKRTNKRARHTKEGRGEEEFETAAPPVKWRREHAKEPSAKTTKAAAEADFVVGGDLNLGDQDDDEEEHFWDVDEDEDGQGNPQKRKSAHKRKHKDKKIKIKINSKHAAPGKPGRIDRKNRKKDEKPAAAKKARVAKLKQHPHKAAKSSM